jgi:phosphoglycerol transferase
LLVCSVLYANLKFDALAYYQAKNSYSSIYEESYIDPNSVSITAGEQQKNLIYIYLESMETTYASVDDGGAQPVNYIPQLTQLARENISFSNTEQLGGYHTVTGAGYTMAALFTTTTGVPYAFPNDSTSMAEEETFASGITGLGDLLHEQGYTQEFLCGSDAVFGGRKLYFQTHGDYEIFDLYTARDQGYIPEDYYVWWGYEDAYLFDIARDEVTRLAESEEPFNLTMLTVDLHHISGYLCDECGSAYSTDTANVAACTDRLVAEFVAWCQQQPFYEDTVIVITGDHPRMDTYLVDGLSYYDRTVYNCFINSAVTTGRMTNREFTHMDIFPTVLAAMGYEIEGDRLGLGTNLFSDQETLAEEMGFDTLNTEVSKSSDYYVATFAPELIQ